jgi:nucleotide-binding universal stress UspA family protein
VALHRILVGLDGSPLAETIVDPVRALAKHLGAEIDNLRDGAKQYLDTLAVGLRRKGLLIETRACIGMPVDTITARASEQAGSVVVMSTHGRSGWRAAVLGSVARRVLLLANAPVLVVRPANVPSSRANEH